MKPLLTLAAAALALTACSDIALPIVQQSAEDASRAAAKAVVGPIVADTVPGATGQVLTNCIIDNATTDELLILAAQGATPANVTLVSNILARPETVACATTGLT